VIQTLFKTDVFGHFCYQETDIRIRDVLAK